MRTALRGLTTRGRSFLAAAVAAAGSALILGENDLFRVAALLAVLPLLAAGFVGRARYRMTCGRTLMPQRVPAGTDAQIRLRLQNLGRLPTGTLLLEDRLPYALGRRPRLVLERLASGQATSVTYTVRPDARGRYQLGPLLVRITDPFGLCELTRSFPSLDRLTVVPRVTPLPAIRLVGQHGGAGESRARSVAVHGDDDAATRTYRHGDDLRRVHWRSTARVGELMVRREEQPWESRATVLLDSRAQAHRGEGPTASYEWAVSATASMATHLCHTGYQVRLLSHRLDVAAGRTGGDGILLDQLADVRTRPRADLGELVDQVRRRTDRGLLVAVLGALGRGEAELISSVRGSGLTCVAFLLDTAGWTQLSPAEREQADHDHRAAVATLVEGGWRVVSVRHGADIAELWPQVGRGPQGFAWRAASAETVAGGVR